MQVAKHQLFHDGDSCSIQASPLICSARRCSSTYIESLFLDGAKHNLLFLLLFFSIWHFTIHRIAGEGEAISLYPFYHFHPLQKTLRH